MRAGFPGPPEGQPWPVAKSLQAAQPGAGASVPHALRTWCRSRSWRRTATAGWWDLPGDRRGREFQGIGTLGWNSPQLLAKPFISFPFLAPRGIPLTERPGEMNEIQRRGLEPHAAERTPRAPQRPSQKLVPSYCQVFGPGNGLARRNIFPYRYFCELMPLPLPPLSGQKRQCVSRHALPRNRAARQRCGSRGERDPIKKQRPA